MIYILSWTTKKHQKNTYQATTFKAEENSKLVEHGCLGEHSPE